MSNDANARRCLNCSKAIQPSYMSNIHDNAATLAAWIAGFCTPWCQRVNACATVEQFKAWWQTPAKSPSAPAVDCCPHGHPFSSFNRCVECATGRA